MWFVRVCTSFGHWKTLQTTEWNAHEAQGSVDKAVADLVPHADHIGISVYTVEGHAEAQDVAICFILAKLRPGGTRGYLLLPESLVRAYGIFVHDTDADEALPPHLRVAHRDLEGIGNTVAAKLTHDLLDDAPAHLHALSSADIRRGATDLLGRHPELRAFVGERWLVELGMGDST